ncbi:uncharacterized protein LOC128273292 [Anopheles cruzii]|uniref:uncharacterized protein LOC128273292 n=1 Tax=Anopheles cruzii TaxID=68878 RepID=UPI0022EC5BBD|nr:uncharacterized protein LOC128273292 [Anopheles cruzii]
MSTLVLVCVLLLGLASSGSTQDIVFPDLKELAIGDPCTIEPSLKGAPFVQHGICRRVRECPTFIPRIIRHPFDIRRDICYFEVHDPVVCCTRTVEIYEQDQYNVIDYEGLIS